ncbi:MAG: TraB/GumN family protein [Sphingomonadaceae bacterium]
MRKIITPLALLLSALSLTVTFPALARQSAPSAAQEQILPPCSTDVRPDDGQPSPPSCASPDDTEPPAPPSLPETKSGPALWKVADDDTTIYLFGTIHILPQETEWYGEALADAFKSADTLVTEVDMEEARGANVQELIMAKGVLPEGQTLHGLLDENQRSQYDAAMQKLGLPLNMFDSYEPWYAAMVLSTLPLLKEGYSVDKGVETTLSASAADGLARDHLETLDAQLSMFDELPMENQISYLMDVVGSADEIKPTIDAMVKEWLEGDAEALADLLNAQMTDPVLTEQLLLRRNRNWASWIQKRLDMPGTVFVAVGAGHLAGGGSVQEELEERGLDVIRVQ